MKARKLRSSVIKIKDSSGVSIDDAADIQKVFVNDFKLHFKSMHGPSSIMVDLPTKVSLEDNMNMIKPVENHEVKEVVLQMDKYKAPESDGFGAAFFQDYWHVIQNDVCELSLIHI